MFKLFKTKEERDLEFISKLWERPKRADKMREVLKYSQTPYEIKAYLSEPELNKSFRYLRGVYKYQILYLAVDENYNLTLTTTHLGYQSWFPISVIYSEFFPQHGTLRRRMEKLALRYLSEFNQLLSEVSPLELKVYSSNLNRVVLKFAYRD